MKKFYGLVYMMKIAFQINKNIWCRKLCPSVIYLLSKLQDICTSFKEVWFKSFVMFPNRKSCCTKLLYYLSSTQFSWFIFSLVYFWQNNITLQINVEIKTNSLLEIISLSFNERELSEDWIKFEIFLQLKYFQNNQFAN
jgi:hypothetical protein